MKPKVCVNASTKNGRISIQSNHRCCAERLLINKYERIAIVNGVQKHKIIPWVRRKMKGKIVIWRELRTGERSCSFPCVMCRKVLEKYDMKIQCTLWDGTEYMDRMTECCIASAFTTSQKKMFKKEYPSSPSN